MPNPSFLAGALSHLLHHAETGCPHSARQAARLLEEIAKAPELDAETRGLYERAIDRLPRSPRR